MLALTRDHSNTPHFFLIRIKSGYDGLRWGIATKVMGSAVFVLVWSTKLARNTSKSTDQPRSSVSNRIASPTTLILFQLGYTGCSGKIVFFYN